MASPVKPSSAKKPNPVKESRLNADKVKAYLRRHPDFLIRHPELVSVLTPPSNQRGENVLDMQHFMIDRLQSELARAEAMRDDIVAASRSNLSSQGRVQGAVLALLEARSFEQFIEVVTTDFVNLLDVDVASLCIETTKDGKMADASTCGVRVLKRGSVGLLMGKSGDIVLRADIKGEAMIYGTAASVVRSDALLRLAMGSHAPAGLLALGSRDAKHFGPNQGKELLQFVGSVLSRLIGGWLHLPS